MLVPCRGKILELVRPILGNFWSELMEIIRLKALGNYSASFWSYNISICLWERPKLLSSMISGFPNVSLFSTPIIVIFGDLRIRQQKSKKNSQLILEILMLIFLEIPRIRLMTSWKYRIWCQYLSIKKHEWKFGNMESLNLWNFEMLNPRNFELWNQDTCKPRNFETKKANKTKTINKKKTRNQ